MPIKMTFSNLLDTDWDGNWSMTAEEGLKTVKQSPAKIMKAWGSEVLWIEQEHLTWYVSGNFHCSCMWVAKDSSNFIFGVSAQSPLHFLTIGKDPYWGVGLRNSKGVFEWSDQVQDQSSPYIIPNNSGFAITITPTLSHSDLALEIVIQKSKTKTN